jgi:methionyl-tRNA formyltransferase
MTYGMAKMLKTKIVFLGSGPVALETLKNLAPDFEFEAIITKSSTYHEMQTAFPDILLLIADHRTALDDLCNKYHFLSIVALVVDYGVIISRNVLDYFPKGIINSHFSLLPEWRGADPITFAILSGQETTGVSLMLLVSKMDEGPLLSQERYFIQPGTTTPQLTDALVNVSAQLIKRDLPKYLGNSLAPVNQLERTVAPSKQPTYSRKLIKADGRIDWNKPATVIEREVRAYISWPRSYTILGGKNVILTAVSVEDKNNKLPGSVIVEKNRLYVMCGEQSLEILRVQPAGKKEMSALAFLAGHKALLNPSST